MEQSCDPLQRFFSAKGTEMGERLFESNYNYFAVKDIDDVSIISFFFIPEIELHAS